MRGEIGAALQWTPVLAPMAAWADHRWVRGTSLRRLQLAARPTQTQASDGQLGLDTLILSVKSHMFALAYEIEPLTAKGY